VAPITFVVEDLDEVDSTNTTLANQAALGAPAGSVVLAAHQLAGRGRLDRRWEAPRGTELLCSVLLRPILPPDALQLATVAVAVAARQALQERTGRAPELKWPNDLLYDGRKVGGILAEAHLDAPGGAAGSGAVVVGLSLNCSFEGPEGVSATSIEAATGVALAPRVLLDAILDVLQPWAEALDTEAGRAALLEHYTAVLSTLGQQVRVELTNQQFEGLATSVGPNGELVVEAGGVARSILSGDVVHLRPLGTEVPPTAS